MHDDESGSAEQGGWQPPEYVSPWLPASGSGDDAEGGNDTISFGSGPAGDANQGPASGPVYHPAQGQPGASGYPAGPGYGGPGYGAAPEYGAPPGYGAAPGYGGAAGYGGPGYGPGAGYGGPGYGGAGYGPPGYGQDPWGGYGAPPPPPRSGFSRTLAYLAVAVLAAGAGAGVAVALNHNSSTPAAIGTGNSGTGNSGTGNSGTGNSGTGGEGNGGLGGEGNNGFGGFPSGNGNSGTGNSGTGGTNTGTGSINATKVAAKVDPGLVDVISDLKYSDATAEGTGMVISSSGLVLTNNHVIDEATSVTATLVVSGKTYTAKVLGYDDTDDVALLQLVGASGLKTVNLGNSAKVKVNQAVLALGNAGGRGGLPSTAQGTILGLDKSIQASDEGADTTENLHDMLETDAPIEQGDSGGPLVNGSGQVIGMDTAANSSETSEGTAATQGFAIPINRAITIADEIANGKTSSSVHIGLAGFMGVNVANANNPSDCGTGGGDGFGGLGGYSPAVNSGALVCDVYPGAPAAASGLAGGDVITKVNGSAVSTANGLTNLMSGSKPGTQLSVVYVDQNGAKHSTTVTLTEWAK